MPTNEGKFRPLVIALFIFACVLESCSLASAGETAQAGRMASGRYPGPRLAILNGQKVFGSLLNKQTRAAVCPRRPLPLASRDVKDAAGVIGRALPALFARRHRAGSPRIDATGARTTGVRALRAHQGETFRPFCGAVVWARSVYVLARLPKVHHSASLSELSFLVARTPHGWIIWGEVH